MMNFKPCLSHEEEPKLLCDPFLQLPTKNSVYVVWFTSFRGSSHLVEWGPEGEFKAIAKSRLMSRLREDIKEPDGTITECRNVPAWRHEALVEGLPAGRRTFYKVVSKTENGCSLSSQQFTFSPAPLASQPLKILLTSDHQLKPMVAANLQKAAETIGSFDAVFFAGDLTEYADAYSDWFTNPRGFFPCLQGTAEGPLEGRIYTGGEIIQHAPLFPCIGNHDVMGRYSMKASLHHQINDSYPKEKAALLHPDASEEEIKNLSYNTDTFQEMFTLPAYGTKQESSPYYAITLGEIRLIVLYATRIWRLPTPNCKGKYNESPDTFDDPKQWGYGDFIFESLEKGSTQYNWLLNELQSKPFQDAKLKIVMLHNPFHSLGVNAIPPFTVPQQKIQRDKEGKIIDIQYSYPQNKDVLIQDIEPLLEEYGVDLIFCGHSHLWNRFQSDKGMHYLETSNVGNSYGAYTEDNQMQRSAPWAITTPYAEFNDPNGLTPIIPTIAPLKNEAGDVLPFISSNEITVFSVLDTEHQVIDSYYFNCRHPEKGIVKFDSFCPYRHKVSIKELKTSAMMEAK